MRPTFSPVRIDFLTYFLLLDQIGAVESVKAASDIVRSLLEKCPPKYLNSQQYAPVSGTIEEINEAVSSQPGLLNKSPEDKGPFYHHRGGS